MGLTRRDLHRDGDATAVTGGPVATGDELKCLAGARDAWMQPTVAVRGGVAYVGTIGVEPETTDAPADRTARDARRGDLDGPSVRGMTR